MKVMFKPGIGWKGNQQLAGPAKPCFNSIYHNIEASRQHCTAMICSTCSQLATLPSLTANPSMSDAVVTHCNAVTPATFWSASSTAAAVVITQLFKEDSADVSMTALQAALPP